MIQSGIVFNLSFLFYQIFIHNRILGILDQIHEKQIAHLWFGLLLAFFILLDLIGFWYKIPAVCQQLRESGKDRTALFIILWILHMVVIFSFLMFIAEALDIKKNENLMFLLMILITIKELIILFLFLMNKPAESKLNKTKEWIGDLCLFIFGIFAYTVTWEYIARQGTHLLANNIVLTLLNVLAASIIFLIFFLPLRTPYILKESILLSNKKNLYLLTGTILFNLIEAMVQIW